MENARKGPVVVAHRTAVDTDGWQLARASRICEFSGLPSGVTMAGGCGKLAGFQTGTHYGDEPYSHLAGPN
jgi:hypothetical protein